MVGVVDAGQQQEQVWGGGDVKRKEGEENKWDIKEQRAERKEGEPSYMERRGTVTRGRGNKRGQGEKRRGVDKRREKGEGGEVV